MVWLGSCERKMPLKLDTIWTTKDSSAVAVPFKKIIYGQAILCRSHYQFICAFDKGGGLSGSKEEASKALGQLDR